MNRRAFLVTMAAACAALSVPMAWSPPWRKPKRYVVGDVRIFINGVEIHGFDPGSIRIREVRS